MAWNALPSSWKHVSVWNRIANDNDGLLAYRSASSVIGWVLLIFAISGLSGTIHEMTQRWPDDRVLLIGGLLFCCLILARGLGSFRKHGLSFDKSSGHVLRTWNWFFWRSKQSQSLAGYSSVCLRGADQPRDINDPDDRRFSITLTGPDEATLTLFENQTYNNSRRLSQEIATLLELKTEELGHYQS